MANGQEIDLKEAKDYVEAHITLKQALKKKVLAGRPSTEDITIHFGSERNAFIFDADEILRFFQGANPAKYLMVFQAAEYNDDGGVNDKHDPTIVVAGLRDNPERTNEYLSMEIDKPASEQPPARCKYHFPDPTKKGVQEKHLVVRILD